MLIQACQKSAAVPETDPAFPVHANDPLKNQHITLKRRHTVLLLATVREGLAKRGAFTRAMAEEFRSADGKKDISEMFNRAVERLMTDPSCRYQVPEYRQTTSRHLVLPAII